jgi:hypothetical protein
MQSNKNDRTDPLQPHASSRMSCYLNFGIVSIYRIIHQVKMAQNAKVSGADKFEEEIVKWREMSYAHTFSRGDYHSPNVVPLWAQQWLRQRYDAGKGMGSGSGSGSGSGYYSRNCYDLKSLECCNSGDDKWDAMQQYLVNTGELHNNVRMTWGKKLVHWNHYNHYHYHHHQILINEDSNKDNDIDAYDPISNILFILRYLNDRYALDGLAPPSYGGLLWCVGWGDKPDKTKGGISAKRQYKLSPIQFQDAESNLMSGSCNSNTSSNTSSGRVRRGNDNESIIRDTKLQQSTIVSMLSSSSKKRQRKDTGIKCTNGNSNEGIQQEVITSSAAKRSKKDEKGSIQKFFLTQNKM